MKPFDFVQCWKGGAPINKAVGNCCLRFKANLLKPEGSLFRERQQCSGDFVGE